MKFSVKYRFFALLCLLLLWILLLQFISPEELVEVVGAKGYLLLFLVAAVGGVSFLTASSYFALVLTLAAGGLNPLLLGIIGGIGVTIGDTLFFLFGTHGRELLSEKLERRMTAFGAWLRKGPPFIVPLAVYVYAAFTPFPNELITVSLGLAGTRWPRVLPALLLGNITITALGAYAILLLPA
jgi:membrane protein DedA with SNARE-associated domain